MNEIDRYWFHISVILVESTTVRNEWSGFSLKDIYRDKGPWGYYMHPVSASKYHSVLYQLPAHRDVPLKPYYARQSDWDDGHVRMPYSEKNVFPVKDVSF